MNVDMKPSGSGAIGGIGAVALRDSSGEPLPIGCLVELYHQDHGKVTYWAVGQDGVLPDGAFWKTISLRHGKYFLRILDGPTEESSSHYANSRAFVIDGIVFAWLVEPLQVSIPL